jgi:hypothetical protein
LSDGVESKTTGDSGVVGDGGMYVGEPEVVEHPVTTIATVTATVTTNKLEQLATTNPCLFLACMIPPTRVAHDCASHV